ncbi:probable polygalacturonase At3g15720 [Macadamia integrifolia]|uniref:probable polygalacturonase At3g15720 n=1 Tax=Macadamia integrifolia TaxID=60698 RepID=UPI001C52F3A4|nr:probable polygalacturonase At3g15720 [Macadamia integrifolia]
MIASNAAATVDVAAVMLVEEENELEAKMKKMREMQVGKSRCLVFCVGEAIYVVRTMGVSVLSFLFCLALLFAWARSRSVPLDESSGTIFDVMNFGAVGDGNTDDSRAFLKAWNEVCKCTAPSTLTILDKTFLLKPLKFQGPCKTDKITVMISGKLTAPSDISEWKDSDTDNWIRFSSINGLTITGSGPAQLDGRGSSCYLTQKFFCFLVQKCSSLPNTLFLDNIIGLSVTGLKFIDSPSMHFVIQDSSWVYVSQLYIVAPGDSPNTDGIHITSSEHVQITDSVIGTGDDCISIETGTRDLNVSRIKCGPGHGISIGSLGDPGEYSKALVEEIHVSNCEFIGTMNGARIKTWQGGSGFAREITFENCTMSSVDNPIVIDQYYCNGKTDCKNQTSAVEVSKVLFRGIKGNSTREVAIELACSETVPCTDIYLKDIDLRRTDRRYKTTSYCDCVHGNAISVVPFVQCLAK